MLKKLVLTSLIYLHPPQRSPYHHFSFYTYHPTATKLGPLFSSDEECPQSIENNLPSLSLAFIRI